MARESGKWRIYIGERTEKRRADERRGKGEWRKARGKREEWRVEGQWRVEKGEGVEKREQEEKRGQRKEDMECPFKRTPENRSVFLFRNKLE